MKIIINLKDLLLKCKKYKIDNRAIVFTNGCFDILHPGHIQLLKLAKEKNNILIVGLNSDNSVRKFKGSERPINNEKYRSFVLSAIKYVDHIIIFDEDTPKNIIQALKPNTLVKGGDWKKEEVVGANFVKGCGGKVKIIPYNKQFSTTKVIENIRNKK